MTGFAEEITNQPVPSLDDFASEANDPDGI